MARLTVYVTNDCMGCVESRTIVAEIKQQYPDHDIALVDLDPSNWPDDIFAVPSYKLDDKIVSLGNPNKHSIQTWFQSPTTQNGDTPHDHTTSLN